MFPQVPVIDIGSTGFEAIRFTKLYVVDDDASVSELLNGVRRSIGIEMGVFESGAAFLDAYAADHHYRI